jgi:hypothetical protein
MRRCTVSLEDVHGTEVHARVAAIIDSTPEDAVVQLRVVGAMPPGLTAASLRAMAGARNVSIAPAFRTAGRERQDRPAPGR